MAPNALTPAVLHQIVNAPAAGFGDVYIVGANFDPLSRPTWIVRKVADGTVHVAATAWIRDGVRTNADLLGLFVNVRQAARRARLAQQPAFAAVLALADAAFDLVAAPGSMDRAAFKSKVADYYVAATTTEDDAP